MKKEYVTLKLADIIPYENNPRINDEAVGYVAESIKQCGYISPIVIDEDNIILCGHTRLKALEQLGKAEAEVMIVKGLTEEQKKKYRILDNHTNEFAEFDMDLLASELEDLDFEGFDFGFDVEEVESDTEVTEDDYEPQDVETRCKLGDLWQLGNHRLICGDSTDVNVIERLMGGQKADIAITSPPYGAGNASKIRTHYVKGKQTPPSFYNEHEDNISEWSELIWDSYGTMTAFSDVQFINIQMLADNKRDLMKFVSDNSENLIDVIVWDKQKAPPQMQSNILNNQYEFVFIFGGKTRTIPYANFHGNINNIIRLTVGVNEYADIHRAVYPVALPSELIRIASEAETVLDIFGGTGTTMIACEQLNRKCFMSELDPAYCDIIIDRWETFTGEKAVLINE